MILCILCFRERFVLPLTEYLTNHIYKLNICLLMEHLPCSNADILQSKDYFCKRVSFYIQVKWYTQTFHWNGSAFVQSNCYILCVMNLPASVHSYCYILCVINLPASIHSYWYILCVINLPVSAQSECYILCFMNLPASVQSDGYILCAMILPALVQSDCYILCVMNLPASVQSGFELIH